MRPEPQEYYLEPSLYQKQCILHRVHMNRFTDLGLWQSQGQAPTLVGNGINWYGGPVLRNKAGVVVRPALLSIVPSTQMHDGRPDPGARTRRVDPTRAGSPRHKGSPAWLCRAPAVLT